MAPIGNFGLFFEFFCLFVLSFLLLMIPTLKINQGTLFLTYLFKWLYMNF